MTTAVASTLRVLVLVALVMLALRAPAAERVVRREVFFREGYDMVPLRRTANHHWYLTGKLDGRRRSCLIDSGWSYTAVSTNTARFLVRSNAVGELRLGNVVLSNQPIAVLDLRAENEPTSYDVVLGLDFLLRHAALLDCGAGRLFLKRGETQSAGRLYETNLVAAGWQAVHLNQLQPPALVCPVDLAGSRLMWLVDSGAVWSCLDSAEALRLGIASAPSLSRIHGPAATARTVAVAELRGWKIGTFLQPDASVAVLNLASLGMGKEGKLFPQITGILGGAELLSRRAIIDFGTRKLWLK